jgi:hypothetical protein
MQRLSDTRRCCAVGGSRSRSAGLARSCASLRPCAAKRAQELRDAICSSSDEGHEALMEVYHSRFTEQIETADADEILTAWE